MGSTEIPEEGNAGECKGGCGDLEPHLLFLCSVLMAMEKEEGSTPSSEEEEEEEEDVALDSDMEQVSERNLATSSVKTSTHPPNLPHPLP